MSQLDWYLRAQLKPRQLHLLVALDDLRHLGRAAASLHVSQPAVSIALGELEKGLGLTLFERGARGVQPNAYGECLIRQARAILACLGQARDDLQALQSGAAGRIVIGALPATTPGLLPRALRLLKRAAPGTRVVVREGAMEALLPELHRGTLDLVVGRLTDAGDAIAQEALHAGHGVVVAGPDHPLARRKRLAWKDVAPYPWVLPPEGTLSRESLENTLRRHGVGMPEDAIETLSIHVIAGYLQIAPALGLLAEPVARHYLDWGWLERLPLALPEPPRPIGMTWSRLKAVTPALERFMQCLRETALAHDEGDAPAPARRVRARRG
jgi:DNA-binding transcriptional LysR family regulator